MKKRYLVVQIGCIECGVSSYPIAFVDTMEEAEKIRDEHPDTWDTEGGEGYVVIWDLNKDHLSLDVDYNAMSDYYEQEENQIW